jgi:hypothetical protein
MPGAARPPSLGWRNRQSRLSDLLALRRRSPGGAAAHGVMTLAPSAPERRAGREGSAMSDSVLVETRGNVLVMTLNRPRARNAIDRSVVAGLLDAYDQLEQSDELRVGVLTGAGGVFCSGLDLKAFLAGDAP